MAQKRERRRKERAMNNRNMYTKPSSRSRKKTSTTSSETDTTCKMEVGQWAKEQRLADYYLGQAAAFGDMFFFENISLLN